MLLRTLAPEDANAYKALRLFGLHECPEAFSVSHEEEERTPLHELQVRLATRADAAVLGAFEGNDLVGTVGLQREGRVKLCHKAFIWGVYVAPSARRKSVAEQLMRFALEYAASNLGVCSVNLGVNTENTAAVALYTKLGFQQYGLEREFLFVNGRYYDEYQMSRRVAVDA
jgi:ribosomal protein S18 acetylase RimI-like enzyme